MQMPSRSIVFPVNMTLSCLTMIVITIDGSLIQNCEGGFSASEMASFLKEQ